MAANYVLIEKITVGAAGASSISFNSIPQTGYTDLKVVFSGRETGNTGSQWIDATLTFNSSTTGYSSRVVYGSGGGTGSTTGGSTGIPFLYSTSNTATASTYGNTEFYVPNYTSSNYKSVSSDTVTENNATPTILLLGASLWSNTAAITSMTLTAGTSFAQYSTFYLYGVAKLGTTPAIVPYATGGDTIMTDGTYWYHAFKSSGTFTPAKALSCDVLVVAGGGGSGNSPTVNRGAAGGGGAGGLLAFTSQSLTTTGYTVTVGAGGAGQAQGSNSVFGALTAAVGGGKGGDGYNAATVGGNGGSGGGGGGDVSTTKAGGTATSGQGNAGGSGGQSGASPSGAGGGGASATGGNGGAGNGGAGGAGISTYSSWGSITGTGQNVSGTYYFAGGGGGSAWENSSGVGGAGGNGGGGAGAATQTSNGTNGTANTGGGGGGGANNLSASGGSGIVIVRYAV